MQAEVWKWRLREMPFPALANLQPIPILAYVTMTYVHSWLRQNSFAEQSHGDTGRQESKALSNTYAHKRKHKTSQFK